MADDGQSELSSCGWVKDNKQYSMMARNKIFRQFQWEGRDGGRGERSRVVFVYDRPH